MQIMDIKRFAVHDGDGIRTTIFFKGCPLRCVWCHNPEGLVRDTQLAYFSHKCINCGACTKLCNANVFDNNTHIFDANQCIKCGKCEDVCPRKAFKLYGKEYSADELIKIALEDIDFYKASGGGITLSGGECLMQPDACREILMLAKENCIHTAVDTCGAVSWGSIEKVIDFTDIFLYDIKAFDEDVHKKCTGASNKLILENLRRIDEYGKKIEIRTVYVPGYNDDQMEKIADFIETLKNVTKVKILPFHNFTDTKYEALGMENTMPKIDAPALDEIEKARKTFESRGIIAVAD